MALAITAGRHPLHRVDGYLRYYGGGWVYRRYPGYPRLVGGGPGARTRVRLSPYRMCRTTDRGAFDYQGQKCSAVYEHVYRAFGVAADGR